jgi:uncharacterized membrane protein
MKPELFFSFFMHGMTAAKSAELLQFQLARLFRVFSHPVITVSAFGAFQKNTFTHSYKLSWLFRRGL